MTALKWLFVSTDGIFSYQEYECWFGRVAVCCNERERVRKVSLSRTHEAESARGHDVAAEAAQGRDGHQNRDEEASAEAEGNIWQDYTIRKEDFDSVSVLGHNVLCGALKSNQE